MTERLEGLRSRSLAQATISAAPIVSEADGQMLWFPQVAVGLRRPEAAGGIHKAAHTYNSQYRFYEGFWLPRFCTARTNHQRHREEDRTMLFHITQTHTPESCPKSAGGSKTLYNAQADSVALKGMYGAFAEHAIYYLVEADSIEAVNQFLLPGFERCASKITAVTEEPIVE